MVDQVWEAVNREGHITKSERVALEKRVEKAFYLR
jgi:hypothetical protein